MASRLDRLKALLKSDLDALPDVPSLSLEEKAPGATIVESVDVTTLADETDSDGGVSLLRERNADANPDQHDESRFVWITDPELNAPKNGQTKGSTASRSSFDLKCGDLAPDQAFCPIMPVSKYPYKFISDNDMQPVASAFFDKGQFFSRDWDLFYVHHPESDQLVTLVSESQFQGILDEINEKFPKLNLRISNWQRENGLVAKFPQFRDTRPRFLGHSNSKDQYNDLVDSAPDPSFRPPGEKLCPNADEKTIEAFQFTVEACIQLNKNKPKSKMTKEKKELDQAMRNKNQDEQFKHLQEYVGLSPANEMAAEKRPTFVAVDVEAYERDNNAITEIGIAILDARDLAKVSPTDNGENWFKFIRAAHIRITEYVHLVNTEFVQGCPGSFDFGQSELLRLHETGAAIRAILNKVLDRGVVLVGHGIQGDIAYLTKLGFNPLNLPKAAAGTPRGGLVEVLDTALLYQNMTKAQNTTSLGNMMYELRLDAWHLHNAGNDAVYTMRALLALCLRAKENFYGTS